MSAHPTRLVLLQLALLLPLLLGSAGSVRAGDMPLVIEPDTRHVLVAVYGRVEDVVLVSPAGQQVTRDAGGHGIEWHLDAALVEISIQAPPAGTWQLSWKGQARVQVVSDMHLQLEPQPWGLAGQLRAADGLPAEVLGRLELDATLRRPGDRDRDLRLVQAPPNGFKVFTDGREVRDDDFIEVGVWGLAYSLQARYPPAPEPKPLVVVERPEPAALPAPRRRPPPVTAGVDPLAPLMPRVWHAAIAGGFDLLFLIGIVLLCLRPRNSEDGTLEELAASRAVLASATDDALARGVLPG